MADDLISGIAKEIAKTGFPLELRVSEFLLERDYSVDHSVYYVDADEGKGRELDIMARRSVRCQKGEQFWYATNVLTIECKKSEKPWVVFTSPKSGEDDNIFVDDDYYQAIGFELPNWSVEETWEVIDAILEISPLYRHPRFGRTYFVPFCGFESGGQIFGALTTCVKSAIYVRNARHRVGNSLSFFYPTIVLQGRLFEAYLEDDEIRIAEIDMMPVSFTYRSANYNPLGFKVPIVTEEALGEYLEMQEKVLDYWVGKIEHDIEI
jgi:hypothetical protein